MSTAYICPMCVFNCDNLPDLEKHLEAHEKNVIPSPIKLQKPMASKAARGSPLYAKSQIATNNHQKSSPVDIHPSGTLNSPTAARSSPNKTYDRRYSCKVCPFSTHSVKTYFNHRQSAHGEQILVTECPYCDYASQYPGKVKKHLADEHPTLKVPNGEKNENSLEPTNKTETKEKSTINETLKSIAARFTDCPFCSFTSTDPEEFRKHVLMNHLNDKNFRCLVCNRLYRYRGDCSFHIRKKHSDLMVGDNVDSLREYVGDFHPNSMTAAELKELLSGPSTPSLSSGPSTNTTPNNGRSPSISSNGQQQGNPPHSFRCGYCKFSSVNSGDVKKHQTWKHANLPSNILPLDLSDPQQQPVAGYKRKRVHSTKGSLQDEEGPAVRRPRLSMPLQRSLALDGLSSSLNTANQEDELETTSKDLLSPNEAGTNADSDTTSVKTNEIQATKNRSSIIGSSSSSVYKCTRCDCLAPHRWIIERHIRAKHASDVDEMSSLIVEIDKPSTNNGEPLTATKSSTTASLPTTIKSSSTSNQDSTADSPPKTFSCSACTLQSYNMWVILRHIRNTHENDGSNAKIIDNVNNKIIEPNQESQTTKSTKHEPSELNKSNNIDDEPEQKSDLSDQEENENQPANMNNEEILKHFISSALATRKNNTNNNFLENLPASLMNTNVAASLATLLGQLTNKQILQQQQQIQQQIQADKSPTNKRYKCSLCSHISAWGGNVKKHLKRMHPGEDSGYVVDLSMESSMTAGQALSDVPILSIKKEVTEVMEQQKFQPTTNRSPTTNENKFQRVFY